MSKETVSPLTQELVREVLALCPIMPVVTIKDPEHAVPLARALQQGGARSIEVTLRTDSALDAIARIAQDVPEIRVGAGTVLSPKDLDDVREAGASFAISPGHTKTLIDHACETDFPYLPAASTVSEVMGLRERGFRYLKLFPAVAVGGTATLKSIGAPIPDVSFCPTGGVSRQNLNEFLNLANVICVGGSWVSPTEAMESGHWDRIEELMYDAVQASAG